MRKKHFWSRLVFVLLALILVACETTGGPSSYGRKSESKDAPAYSIFYIEGMPCVWVENTRNAGANYATGYAGLSCDWSRWKGE